MTEARKGKIVITGAAGLVGQNLIPRLTAKGFTEIVAIDKHATNVKILKKYHPAVCVLHKDLAEGNSPVNGWSEELIGCHALSLRMHRLAGWTRRSLNEITSWPRSACWKLPYDTKFRTLSAFRRRS